MSELVRVNWVDSHSPNMGPWIDQDEIDHDILKIETVGFIIHESKNSITLASQIARGNSNQVGGVISIPKVCIQKRQKLK